MAHIHHQESLHYITELQVWTQLVDYANHRQIFQNISFGITKQLDRYGLYELLHLSLQQWLISLLQKQENYPDQGTLWSQPQIQTPYASFLYDLWTNTHCDVQQGGQLNRIIDSTTKSQTKKKTDWGAAAQVKDRQGNVMFQRVFTWTGQQRATAILMIRQARKCYYIQQV